MDITPLRVLCFAGCLLAILPVQAQAGEKKELALVIKQLEQINASLDRARKIAPQQGQLNRFYFDYSRAKQDINTLQQGIKLYLEPSRAQPIIPTIPSISGQYRQERRS